jgi:hypothetical protein
MSLVAMLGFLIAASVGIWAMLTHVAADPGRASAAKPTTAAMSPLEIMKERGHNLPPEKTAEPF